jgi:aryl-alcohol dehydrogenase-like predicted oxidoreductase
VDLRRVGSSGLKVSMLGLGCNNFGGRLHEEGSVEVVHACLDAGVTFFDTADIYGEGRSEEILGRALGGRREEVVIATKFSGGQGPYLGGASRKVVMTACEHSLRRLGTDYIDLYYQHFPDPATPVTETLGALDDLVRAGKVRYVGTSNFAGWQIARAEEVARANRWVRPVASQSEWNLLRRGVEWEVVPACSAYGVGVVPYFPLASGLLTGKYRRGEAPAKGTRLGNSAMFASWATTAVFDMVERLDGIARQHGRTLLELAVGWLAAQPTVPSVIIGATQPEQVAANARAARVQLSDEELAAVSAATAPPPAVFEPTRRR